MFTSQITDILTRDPAVSPFFAGVFPRDQLPQHVSTYPCALVANTHPQEKEGEHWVAYYFDNNGNGEYFDSYGLAPLHCDLFKFFVNNGEKYMCNDTQLQGINSKVCGQYCIAFLTQRARGKPMAEIVRSYKGMKPGAKDNDMARQVNKLYKIKRRNQAGDGFASDQCCCARNKCKY